MTELLYVLIVVTTVVSLVLIVVAGALYLRYTIPKWPKTKAKVLESKVEKRYDKQSKMDIYVPIIEYVYKLGSKEYHSGKIEMFLNVLSFVDRLSASAYTEKYKIGMEHNVYYHPLFRNMSVLQISHEGKGWLIATVIFVVLVEMLCIAAWYFSGYVS